MQVVKSNSSLTCIRNYLLSLLLLLLLLLSSSIDLLGETRIILKFSHGNMAYVMIMLFINIELFMVDNYLSKGFPGQLDEALCKCIGMILA